MWEIKLLHFDLHFYFYNFIIYSFLGWIYESCLVSFDKKKLINRGFLNGPVIPIYGVGATSVYVLLYSIRHNAVLVFLGGMVFATGLEFFASYILEKLFDARWWDYSQYRWNINGRICVTVSLFWGFMSILVTEVIQNLVNTTINGLPRSNSEIVAYIILVIFLVDLLITIIFTLKLDKKIANMQKLREEFYEYIENFNAKGITAGLRNRLEQLQIMEWTDTIKEKIEIGRKKSENSQEGKEYKEIEGRFRLFVQKYQKNTSKKPFVQKRLLHAFPEFKLPGRESVFKDFKDKIFEKKRKKED